jgi:hypothetical protein
MARAWSQTARLALEGGRLWRGLVKKRKVTESEIGFRSTDMIVIGLLLDLADIDCLVCPETALRTLVEAVFVEQGGPKPRRCVAAADGTPHLLLTSIKALGRGASGGEGCAAHAVHGIADVLPLSGSVSLRVLACTAPALWQCGLALVVGGAGDAGVSALIGDLALSMRGEWIDPLALYERVQVLTAKLKAPGQSDDRGEAEPVASRLAELERELASLKRAALVNQHLMLVDAAERVRNPT